MITLVPINPQNAMTFKTVRLRALQDTPMAFGRTYAEESKLTDANWVQRAGQWSSDRSGAFLAMDGELPCGIAGTLLDPENTAIANLVSMWIAPTHRRKGVGVMLVNAIIELNRARGVRDLRLEVVCNNDSAIKFYEYLGFTRTGRTVPYPNDPALIEYEMSRALS